MNNLDLNVLKKYKIVAILRGLTPEQCSPVAGALRAGGIRMIEVTFDQTDPDRFSSTTEAIRLISEEFPDMYVGAGTVLTEEQTDLAYAAGARFIISPNVCEAVIRRTKELGMLSFPGAFTPTEIEAAYAMGADAVKVFPSDFFGPAYIKAVLAPLKHIPLIAVGGVNENNIAAYFEAGAVGIGTGGRLNNPQWVRDGAYDKITDLARRFVEACGADSQ